MFERKPPNITFPYILCQDLTSTQLPQKKCKPASSETVTFENIETHGTQCGGAGQKPGSVVGSRRLPELSHHSHLPDLTTLTCKTQTPHDIKPNINLPTVTVPKDILLQPKTPRVGSPCTELLPQDGKGTAARTRTPRDELHTLPTSAPSSARIQSHVETRNQKEPCTQKPMTASEALEGVCTPNHANPSIAPMSGSIALVSA
jgi:hypothetical protein